MVLEVFVTSYSVWWESEMGFDIGMLSSLFCTSAYLWPCCLSDVSYHCTFSILWEQFFSRNLILGRFFVSILHNPSRKALVPAPQRPDPLALSQVTFDLPSGNHQWGAVWASDPIHLSINTPGAPQINTMYNGSKQQRHSWVARSIKTWIEPLGLPFRVIRHLPPLHITPTQEATRSVYQERPVCFRIHLFSDAFITAAHFPTQN